MRGFIKVRLHILFASLKPTLCQMLYGSGDKIRAQDLEESNMKK